jgi:hypothetical protein
MGKFFREFGIPAGLIIVKLLITLRTGIDTYNVSHDILDVLVIDGAYLAMWMVAAYAGKGQSAMALRPFAAAGAWILYGLMLYIAWQAGDLRGNGIDIAVSLIARVAGAVLLSYDTYDYIQALMHQRQRDSAATWQDSLRSAVNALAYITGAVLAIPLVVILNIVRAGKDYQQDARGAKTAKIVVQGRTAPALPSGKTDDVDRQLLELYAGNPLLPLREAGKEIGKSHTAVSNRLAKLERDGVIYRNGHGVEIVE